MKKKFWVFILTLIFVIPCALVLSACNGDDDTSDKYVTVTAMIKNDPGQVFKFQNGSDGSTFTSSFKSGDFLNLSVSIKEGWDFTKMKTTMDGQPITTAKISYVNDENMVITEDYKNVKSPGLTWSFELSNFNTDHAIVIDGADLVRYTSKVTLDCSTPGLKYATLKNVSSLENGHIASLSPNNINTNNNLLQDATNGTVVTEEFNNKFMIFTEQQGAFYYSTASSLANANDANYSNGWQYLQLARKDGEYYKYKEAGKEYFVYYTTYEGEDMTVTDKDRSYYTAKRQPLLQDLLTINLVNKTDTNFVTLMGSSAYNTYNLSQTAFFGSAQQIDVTNKKLNEEITEKDTYYRLYSDDNIANHHIYLGEGLFADKDYSTEQNFQLLNMLNKFDTPNDQGELLANVISAYVTTFDELRVIMYSSYYATPLNDCVVYFELSNQKIELPVAEITDIDFGSAYFGDEQKMLILNKDVISQVLAEHLTQVMVEQEGVTTGKINIVIDYKQEDLSKYTTFHFVGNFGEDARNNGWMYPAIKLVDTTTTYSTSPVYENKYLYESREEQAWVCRIANENFADADYVLNIEINRGAYEAPFKKITYSFYSDATFTTIITTKTTTQGQNTIDIPHSELNGWRDYQNIYVKVKVEYMFVESLSLQDINIEQTDVTIAAADNLLVSQDMQTWYKLNSQEAKQLIMRRLGEATIYIVPAERTSFDKEWYSAYRVEIVLKRKVANTSYVDDDGHTYYVDSDGHVTDQEYSNKRETISYVHAYEDLFEQRYYVGDEFTTEQIYQLHLLHKYFSTDAEDFISLEICYKG